MIFSDFRWLFDFHPNVVDILDDFSPDFTFLIFLVIKISDTEKQSFRWLLLELWDTNVQNCIQCFILRPSILSECFRPDIDNQGISFNKGKSRDHFLIFLLMSSFFCIITFHIHDDDVGLLIQRNPNSHRSSVTCSFL